MRRVLKSGVLPVVLYLIVMLLITFLGRWQYYASRPIVQAEAPQRTFQYEAEGNTVAHIVSSVAIVDGGYVYALIPVSNFFLSGYIVEKQPVEVLSTDGVDTVIRIENPSIQIVVAPVEEMENRMKVRLS